MKILVEKKYQFDTIRNQMAEKEIPRSIRFPKELWDVIDRDAVRCRRSAVKQLESLLLTYYELENVDLDHRRLESIKSQQVEKPDTKKQTKVYIGSKPELKEKKKAG